MGCDFQCFSLGQIEQFDRLFSEKGIILKDSGDLFETIWKDRPKLSEAAIYEHEVKFAGNSRKEKLKELRHEMEKAGADFILLSALDEVAH